MRENSEMHNVQECECYQASHLNAKKVVWAGNFVVLDEKNSHIRNSRNGTTINLDANNGVYTMDMCFCTDKTGPVFSLTDTLSDHKSVSLTAMCERERTEDRKFRRSWENRIEKSWRGRRRNVSRRRRWHHTDVWGQDPGTNQHRGKKGRVYPCNDLPLHENAARREFPNNIRRSNDLHYGKRRQTPKHNEQRSAEERNRRNIDKWESDKIHRSAWIPRITLKSDKKNYNNCVQKSCDWNIFTSWARRKSHSDESFTLPLAEHAESILSRCQKGRDWKTPFERLHGKNPTQESFRLTKRCWRNKSPQIPWTEWFQDTSSGICFEMRNNSAKYFIGTAGVVFRAPEVRRLESQSRWELEVIINVIGIPWRMTDDRWTVDRPKIREDPVPILPPPFEGATNSEGKNHQETHWEIRSHCRMSRIAIRSKTTRGHTHTQTVAGDG